MSDPVTIGLLAANALGIAAKAALDGVVGAATKDLYVKLKAQVAAWAPHDVEALEKAPTSLARQSALAEVVDAQEPVTLMEVRGLVQQLVEALEQEQPIGVEIGTLKALSVRLGEIEVSNGVGFRAREIVAEGDFTIGQLQVGSAQKKT